MYRDDTALHVAAAVWRRDVAALLVDRGADVRARNRRGARPTDRDANGKTVAEAAQRDSIRDLLITS